MARRLIYFLLVTMLINAGGWTFNREAVADVFFAAEEAISMEAVQPSLQAAHHQGEPLKAMVPCNHWCYAVGHFLGLFGEVPALSPDLVTDYSLHVSRFLPEPAQEGRFRPPRLIS
ncbi:MAG: hypothetical protein A2X71_11320 [Thiobacillus sp. GWE1_62_9]|jgi:hypothetical protein|uniref:hypothetical protein n=1 Tax=Thiobacillus sp. 65-1402 TaxID=1895861 RepID=UPI0008BED3A2|nr:hypothetical protein [Thiobacillus sp. 65-1402]MDZ7584028.1 hypothetical protein [Thiobacillus sp.]OHE61117.1 MAG: hypothetical protein A2X71_11320 [Thiobacillus sp. GWE1_62_9]OYX29799.1 MAG: hypothetical protein B7Z03_07910 [Hydrogenophilales bacterium 32-62-9]OYZ53601.1 MAG: hypothetical protein B7Y21_15085 [Hydrogenophilales bacterium 16-61-112]HMN14522.1 hypothetical protein [Bellilinea sp.]HQT51736.1 hypothetical protein [Acidovorax defluvii]